MAGFNRPGSQPPGRRGLFANRSERRGDDRRQFRRVDSAAPTRAAVSYTSQRAPKGGGGSFGRAITTLITRLVGLGAVVILIAAAVLGVRLVISLGEPTQSAAPSDAVPSAAAGRPLIVAPDPATVASSTITIRGSLPDDLLGISNALLRISVVGTDGAQRIGAEIELPRTPGFELSGVPLTEGENEITAVVVVDGVARTPSDPISVTRDNTAPVVEITSPTPGQLVSGAEVTVRGTSEAGVEILLRNDTSGLTASGKANGDGKYAVNISLRDGGEPPHGGCHRHGGKQRAQQRGDHHERLGRPRDCGGESRNHLLEQVAEGVPHHIHGNGLDRCDRVGGDRLHDDHRAGAGADLAPLHEVRFKRPCDRRIHVPR